MASDCHGSLEERRDADVDERQRAMRILIGTVVGLFFGLLTAHFARRKNREVLVWGLLGLHNPLALILLAFVRFLCPKCRNPLTNAEARTGKCPHCTSDSERPTETEPLELSEKWRFEPRRIDDCQGIFLVEMAELRPFVDHVVQFLESYRDPSIGRFCPVKLSSQPSGDGWQISSTIDFFPFERGISQDVELLAAPQAGSVMVEFSVRRISGDAQLWWEHNRSFMNALRKEILAYEKSARRLRRRTQRGELPTD